MSLCLLSPEEILLCVLSEQPITTATGRSLKKTICLCSELLAFISSFQPLVVQQDSDTHHRAKICMLSIYSFPGLCCTVF